MPITIASRQPSAGKNRLQPTAIIAITTLVITTWLPPNPKIGFRICHNFFGFSSKPIRNSNNTTPNSEKCKMASTSDISPNPHGPIPIPAIKYPSTDPNPNRCANGTAMMAAPKNTTITSKKSLFILISCD